MSLMGAANILDLSCKRVLTLKQAFELWLEDGYAATSPVGSFRANPFGMHDVIGNVWEWCLDRYGSYELPVDAATGERLVSDSRERAVRGGGWHAPARGCRSSARNHIAADSSVYTGVRPARRITW